MLIELHASEVAKGHAVIVNDIDQPCSKLIAIVIEAGDIVCARYLNADLGYDKLIKNPRKYVTPVNDFGVKLYYDTEDGKYHTKVVSESVAKYPDGAERQWQARGADSIQRGVEHLAITFALSIYENATRLPMSEWIGERPKQSIQGE